jgi:hypothetical protein
MLPKSLHTVRVLQTVARMIEQTGAHAGDQAIYAAAAVLGYTDTAANQSADPVLVAACKGYGKPARRS